MTPLANHLWQSTVFVAAIALLAFTLRKNRAQVRYVLWLIASAKFLIPFSLIVALGSFLAPPAGGPLAQPELSVVIQNVSQPFTAPVIPASIPYSPDSHLGSTIFFAVWLCGFIAVVLCWCARWRRIHTAIGSARLVDIEAGIPVFSSPSLLEPGVFGVFRPVLLLPEGITDHLTRAQLHAIIAHELCHIRRRDNLAAAIHMLVEAIFWFHPLVWWIGARLMEERERACDEDVLRLGSEPQVYAESILKACEFYLESPLACMSGVTGADLKKRIVRIMTHSAASRMNFAGKALLALAASLAIAGPLAFGFLRPVQSQATGSTGTKPQFDVASIKPDKSSDGAMWTRDSLGRFSAHGITVGSLIQDAYDLHSFQISGGPGWINSTRYDIEAKPDTPEPHSYKLTPDQREAMRERQRLRLQSLLADRFQFKFHRATKEMPVYALIVAKNGPRLNRAKDGEQNGMGMGPGHLTGRGLSMYWLAANLSNIVSRVVLDKTGLSGSYDFTLKWAPSRGQANFFDPESKETSLLQSGPSIFTAIQEQLGLKLKPEKGPVEVLVIDHVEKASAN